MKKVLFLFSSLLLLYSTNNSSFGQVICSGSNFLINGSFETPIVAVSGGGNNITQMSNIPGWINKSTDSRTQLNIVRMLSGPSSVGPDRASQGDQYIDLHGSLGMMEQVFTLDKVAALKLQGFFAHRILNANTATSAIGIKLINSKGITVSEVNSTIGPSDGYNWVELSTMTSLLQPGQYTFQFSGNSDALHYDNMSVCVAQTTLMSCSSSEALPNPGNWVATASVQSGSASPTYLIDGITKVSGTNYWTVPVANIGTAYMTIDFQSALDINGFVYYPVRNDLNDLKGYRVSYSNDGTNFTTIQQGSLSPKSISSGVAVADPIIQPFSNVINARYLRLTVLSSQTANPVSILEFLPLICNTSPTLPLIGCGQVNLLNSGTNANGSARKLAGTFDNNWKIAFYSGTGSLSYSEATNLTYLPALVTGNTIPGAWANSPFNNAEWLSYTPTGLDINTLGMSDGQSPNVYYYRYKFNITDPYLLRAFKIKLDFYVDNIMNEVFVNGVSQTSRLNLPQGGYRQNNRVTTELSSDWIIGENEILINTHSTPPFNGFLIQNVANCLGIDFGDAPNSYGVLRSDNGPGHVLETNSGQVQLMLGSTIDGELDGSTSVNADGDGVDEDGIIGYFPPIPHTPNPIVTNYEVNIKLKNLTNKTAHLVGWIDWNRNGTFEQTEGVKVLVAPNVTQATLTWPSAAFIGNPAVDHTYARFRISTDELTPQDMLGPAFDGEVEDYKVIFPAMCDLKIIVPNTNNNWSVSSNAPSLSSTISRVIDGSVAVGNEVTIPQANLPAEIVFDYGSVKEIGGFAYYPNYSNTASGRLDMEGYNIYLSNDGVTYNLVKSGLISLQDSLEPTRYTQAPTRVAFDNVFGARYMKLEVLNPTTSRNVSILELLPVLCETPSPIEVVCGSADLFNTGTNITGSAQGTLATFDHNWEVFRVSKQPNITYNEIKDSIFYPACIVGNKVPGIWANSPYAKSEWISLAPSGHDRTDTMDYFYRIRFQLNDAFEFEAFKLNMDFMADNSVQDIYVNGIGIAPLQLLPQSVSNAYRYGGFYLSSRSVIQIKDNLRLGTNEIMVRVRSDLPLSGFLAQNTSNCVGFDFGDAPSTYKVSRSIFGAGHTIDTLGGGLIPLYMGTTVDTETDGIPSNLASSDDANNAINDESGVTINPMQISFCSSEAYSAVVNVTNRRSTSAILAAWIDFDGDGTFNESEATIATIPGNTIAQNVTLNWTSQPIGLPLTATHTFGRFRIASTGLSAGTPNGLMADGEVEDYFIPIVWVKHDFGNLNPYVFPIASTIIPDASAVWLGAIEADDECATNTADHTDGIHMNQIIGGDGTANNPWILRNSIANLTFDVSLNSATANQNVNWASWIDIDGNGSFNDAVDLFTTGSSMVGNSTSVVPVNISIGTQTLDKAHMRTIATTQNVTFTKVMNGAGTFGNGEVEDHYLEFVEPLPITWLSLKAFNNTNYHNVNWSFTKTTERVTHFEVETMSKYGETEIIGTVGFVEGNKDYQFSNYQINYQNGQQQYRVVAMHNDEALSYSQWVSVNANPSLSTAIAVYPNPFDEHISIADIKPNSEVIIINTLGQIVYKAHVKDNLHIVNARHWNEGVYIIHIKHPSQDPVGIKVVKSRK